MSKTTSNTYRTGLVLAVFSLFTTATVTVLTEAPAVAATSIDCSRGVNLSYEQPVIPDTWRLINESAVPGWDTEAPDGIIEFWVDGFLGFSATDGNQLSELQANGTAAVYQDIQTVEGDAIAWRVDHRGRATTEEARVQIGAPGAETTVQQMITSPSQWVTYGGSYTVPTGQTTTRFMLRPIGSGSVGNLVDNVVLALTCGLTADTSGSTIADTDGSGSDTPGDVATVTTSITNTGTATLLDLGLSDSAATTTSCVTTTLLPSETSTCSATYNVDQAAIDAGAFSGTAVVAGHDAGNVSISDSAPYSVPLAADPSFDVALDAVVDQSVVAPSTRADAGDTILFSGTVTNTGNVTLATVAVSTDVTGVLSCSSSTIAPGASTTCTATHVLTQTDIDDGSVTATGSFSATPAQGEDLAASAQATATIDPDSVLTVTHNANPVTYDSPGESISISVTVSNAGNTTLSGIVVTEDLADVGTLDCGGTPFDLTPGEQRLCNATRSVAQPDLDAGQISGFAIAVGQDTAANPVTGTSTELVVFADQQPSITVSAVSTLDLTVTPPLDRADLGDSATATYTVTNTGNVTLSVVTLAGPLGSPIDCPSTNLAPSDSQNCIVTVALSQADIDAGLLDASATVSAQAPDASTVSSAATHTIAIGRVSDIVIETTNDSVISNGDGTYTVAYTITVTNAGNTTITTMNVLDGLANTFPDATVSLVSWTPISSGAFSPTLVLQPADVATATYAVVVRAAGDPGPYDTVSTVTATSPTGDVGDQSSLSVQFDVSYDLVLTHDASTSVAPGTTYTHVFTIANDGPSAALGPIVLTTALDPSTPFVSYAGTGWLCTTAGSDVTCTNQANLNAGTSTQVSVDVLINAGIGATPTSTARVAATNDSDDDPASNVFAVTLQVEQLPKTGFEFGTTGLAGLMFLLLGAAAVLFGRRETRAEFSA